MPFSWFSKRPSVYALKHSRSILQRAFKIHQENALSPQEQEKLDALLRALDQAVFERDRERADQLARQVEVLLGPKLNKKPWGYFREICEAILIAFLVAVVVRQSWFELYEIPTGSMRPTFKERDHLIVAKDTFGINIPLVTSHFLFEPQEVKRGGIVIWSGDQISHLDSASTFMGFPYTKRFVKRCMGKPGDILYFYGGKIYGIDAEGNDLTELRTLPELAKIDHVPFTGFEGRIAQTSDPRQGDSTLTFYHFNAPIGKLRFFREGGVQGKIFNGKEWITDRAVAQNAVHAHIETFSDFWGIRNFALARLLDEQQLRALTPFSPESIGRGVLYLELRHTPSLSYPKPLLRGRTPLLIPGYTAVIPLQEEHLERLMQQMYTGRFLVKNEQGAAYRQGNEKISQNSPRLQGVPDGMYEFYYGKGMAIRWGGITEELPREHPLMQMAPSNVQRLFNFGIEMSTLVEPKREHPYFPSRYVYFRNGDLYAMGGALLRQGEETLAGFEAREKERVAQSTASEPYVAFRDYGAPLLSNGSVDRGFISTFGLKIPERHYLVLGDNHAMSQDSRYFGSVPEDNMQGTPSWILWPPGSRWGEPLQPPYAWVTTPRLLTWGSAALVGAVYFLVQRRARRRRYFG